MAKTKGVEDFRQMNLDDLSQELNKAREELWEIRRKRETESFTNTALIGQTRRKVARIKTVINEKTRESEVAS